jgi:hypothetical protein
MARRCFAAVLLSLVCTASTLTRPAVAAPQVPCYFVFGDSLVDNGNNNVIVSLARANYPPYGIDFAGGPTGRFSNGLTTVDVIGKLNDITTAIICWSASIMCKVHQNWRVRVHAPFDLPDPSTKITLRTCAAKLLGFNDFIPPFAGATSEQLLTGVNFNSAAAGIREETGQQLVHFHIRFFFLQL